jgi:uncharacterized protein
MVYFFMIEFDAAKDRLNLSSHGVRLALAEVLFATEAVVHEVLDDREEYGEDRWIAYGLIAARAFVCVYTWRGASRRIISLRKANAHEQALYFS